MSGFGLWYALMLWITCNIHHKTGWVNKQVPSSNFRQLVSRLRSQAEPLTTTISSGPFLHTLTPPEINIYLQEIPLLTSVIVHSYRIAYNLKYNLKKKTKNIILFKKKKTLKSKKNLMRHLLTEFQICYCRKKKCQIILNL